MLRRIAVAVLIVVVTGLVPLMANGGSCADMPCCHQHGAVISTSTGDCCAPPTCVKEEQAIRASASIAQRHLLSAAVVAVLPVSPELRLHSETARQHHSWSPPLTTTERLSVLSILLI
ncbi:MAG: hypothetical protein NVSMB68_13260 [Thermoanaerobaculia bacterium]